MCDRLGNDRHPESMTDEGEDEIHLAGAEGHVPLDSCVREKLRDDSFQSQSCLEIDKSPLV